MKLQTEEEQREPGEPDQDHRPGCQPFWSPWRQAARAPRITPAERWSRGSILQRFISVAAHRAAPPLLGSSGIHDRHQRRRHRHTLCNPNTHLRKLNTRCCSAAAFNASAADGEEEEDEHAPALANITQTCSLSSWQPKTVSHDLNTHSPVRSAQQQTGCSCVCVCETVTMTTNR